MTRTSSCLTIIAADLQRLVQEDDHAATLRCFEKHLLQELGYALLPGA